MVKVMSNYLKGLNMKVEEYYKSISDKRRRELKYLLEEKKEKKKMFQERIDYLINIYYPLIINELETQSSKGMKIGCFKVEKDDFELQELVNNTSLRNVEIMMKNIMDIDYDKLYGLQYFVWNIDNDIIIKLMW